MRNLLARILCSAAHSMWQKDPTLGQYTSDTNQHELNLAFHYASELRNWFPNLDCDFDVSKASCNDERPDIVLHRRKTHALNYLVIEIKREQYRRSVPLDLEQIRKRWFENSYQYRFGASVILEDDKPEFEVQVLERSNQDDEPVILKHSNMGKPLAQPSFDRILAAKAKAAETDLSRLPQEIDELLYALYDLKPEEIKIGKGKA